MFRCSRCGRKRRGYDRGGGRRRWRHRDFGCRRVKPVAGMPRVDRPRCGVVVAMAPWAEPGSRFTRDFESECAWLTSVANRKTASGFPQPHPRDRRTRPEDPPSWARHPQDNRTGLLQRQARGVQQQDQGHHPHGLRLPPRHQPHRPDHAPMQRTRHPTTTTHNLTHKNSRSLSSIQLFVRPPQGSNQALQKARHRFREESAACFHKGTQSQDHTHRSIPISTRT